MNPELQQYDDRLKQVERAHARTISTWPPLEPQHQMKNSTCPKKGVMSEAQRERSSSCAEVYEIAPYPWNPLLRRPLGA